MSDQGVSAEKMEQLRAAADAFGRRGGLFLDGWFLVDAMIRNTPTLADVETRALSSEQIDELEQRIYSAADNSPDFGL